jgi:ATP-binding cassette subfamily F protein 3
MPLLTLANIVVRYGTQIVLDGATTSIEPGERVGLVGRNGSGKTTLMKVMLQALEPDAGSMQMQRGARVGYLAQDPQIGGEQTVRDVAEEAFAELHQLHLRLNEVFAEMAEATGDALDRLLKKQARLESAIEAAGGYAIDHRIDAMLHGLGFSNGQFNLQVKHLSGGQRGRLGLARLLLEEPDLLLLDEPTNHLDIAGRKWLETFLTEDYRGAVLVVSHDRWLLDRVVHRIVEVERGVIREYPGNYQKYTELRHERQATQERVHQKQLDRIRQEQQFIARYKTGQRAKQARGRQSRLDRFKRDELVERPAELSVMRLSLPKSPRSGDQVLSADSITKRYENLTLFENFSLTVARGDRIGIIGPNGVGKTTLIRCMLGDESVEEGDVRSGTRLSVGYYRQVQDHLDLSLTIWQYLQSVIVALESKDGAGRASEQEARDLAGAFLFSGLEQDKTLADVSGGERSRAVLAGLVAGAHNLLVLDEPTNHLDIPSAERLEQALALDGGYDGTLLLISHDRALLEATCDTLLIFDGAGGLRLFHGRYSDWERREATERQAAHQAKQEAAKAETAARRQAARPVAKKTKKDAGNPLSHLNFAELERRIEAIEKSIEDMDARLLDPAVYSDGEKVRALQQERTAAVDELGPLEAEWERRAEEDDA